MRKFLFLCLSVLLSLGAANGARAVAIKVGASPTPHVEILLACEPILNKQGITLVVAWYADYVQPNMDLDAGRLDANYFQHKPYLDDFNARNGTRLVAMESVHYEPLGIYPGRTNNLKELQEGAVISVPNDATNRARALLLLQQEGLIKLKSKKLDVTPLDIVENPLKLRIKEIEAAKLVRSRSDVDLSVINGNYALLAGLDASSALAVEAPDSAAAKTYTNILAVREGEEQRPELKALAEALKSVQVKEFMTKTYNGSVVPK